MMSNVPALGETSCENIEDAVNPVEFSQGIVLGTVDGWRKYCVTEPAFTNLKKYRDRVEEVLSFFGEKLQQSNKPRVTLKYCLTGSLSAPRKKLVDEFARKGAKFVSIGKADILIANGPSSNSKYTRAVKRGIPILSEAEFRERLEG